MYLIVKRAVKLSVQVGKKKLLLQKPYKPCFLINFQVYQQNGRQHRIHLQLWDTAGQERCVPKFIHLLISSLSSLKILQPFVPP